MPRTGRCRAGRRSCRPAEHETKQRFVPADAPADSLRVGVEYELVRIETVARVRGEGTVYAVAIELPRLQIRHVAVPHHVGLLGQRNGQRLDVRVGRLEETELNPGRVFGEECEVDADTVPGRAQGIG